MPMRSIFKRGLKHKDKKSRDDLKGGDPPSIPLHHIDLSCASAASSTTRFASYKLSPRARLVSRVAPVSTRATAPAVLHAGLTFLCAPQRDSNFGREDSLRVVIVGAGFAGLGAAVACARQNFSVTVLERSSGLSPHGDSIMFGANASRLMDRWGIGEEMFARGASKGGWWLFKDQAGHDVWQGDLDALSAQVGAPVLQGRRPTFLASLGTQARVLGVNIRLHAEVVQYWDSDDEPAVVLASGEVIKGDVVIVADGVHSTARHLLASHKRPTVAQRRTGYSIHRGVMTSEAIAADPVCAHLLDGNIRTWLGPDAHICTYPMENGRSLAFTFTHADARHAASLDWRDKKPISEVLDLLDSKWDPTLRRAMRHFTSTLHWEILDEVPEAEWISAGGKICFIGDAVHAMMPTALQGGSQAIEDAATIALCLAMAGSNPGGVRLALQVHEKLRRPFVEQAQALGFKQQDIWHNYTSSPTGDWIAQAVQNAEIDRSSLDGRAKRERVRGSPRPIE
ncbi:hypothetical protein DMC30DRAFT_267762 [Rhodotorula diobovata]|uniref:FAD-binding domain-containing protein n=1 Tax=Rhodotorula diobovata TaxID=5288 RepID=A0A5C5FTM3_9BASI|nr:hypothetical protein DMC30DRAFT_267762 [Rhodotorula diobovata]